MLHSITGNDAPQVSSVYCIERQTVWQTCDRENILVVMVEGNCLFRLNGREYAATKGDAVYIPAGQEYQRLPVQETAARFTYFHFAFSEMPRQRYTEELSMYLTKARAQVYLSPDHPKILPQLMLILGTLTHLTQEALEITAQAVNEYESGTPESRLYYTLSLCRLLAMITRETIAQRLNTGAAAQDAALPVKLRDAILFIRRNHDKPITVAQVCMDAGISRQHMIRLFRAELGMTPIQYINHTKILHAKDLLWRNNNLSVKELAYELGFSDEHYFGRLFTKEVGETPTAFRTRVISYSALSCVPK